MATAQTATGPIRNYPDRRFPAVPAMASHMSPREPSHTRTGSGQIGADDFRGVKRRADIDEEARRDEYVGHPGYASSSYRSDVPGGSTAARIPPEAAYLRNGSSQAYEGSRTHLPPISSMPAGHADEPPKKRRPGYPYDHYSDSSNPRQHVPHASYGRDAEEARYRNSSGLAHNGPPSPSYLDDRAYMAHPHSARPHPGLPSSPRHHSSGEDFPRPPHGSEDQYDQSTLLARRRGDAAQAKPSRLHIDVGSASSDRSLESSAPPAFHRPNSDANLIARSAPPTKVSFSDRDGQMPDPRGGPPRADAGYPSSSPHYSQRGGPSSRSYPDGHGVHHATRSPPHGEGGEAPHSFTSSRSGPNGPISSHLPPNSSTPLTGRFVPHTATLPSPAYHTTRMMQAPPGSSAAQHPGSLTVHAPPRTAGLTPGPPTARLPDHLRSPPSSKAQFLSLFSHFHDSLSDSRTLKATLEDQVRRSNALIQTLQKSSKVLEATVDRKIREERSVWQARVTALEARVRELEGGEPLARSRSKTPEGIEAEDGQKESEDQFMTDDHLGQSESDDKAKSLPSGVDGDAKEENRPTVGSGGEGDDPGEDSK